MKVVTWNINSIKVRLPAVLQYLDENKPDMLALQETKCIDDNFPFNEISELGYNSVFAGQKTYNGVAIISQNKPSRIELNPISTDENEMRSITASYNDIRLINLYVVNGQNVGTDKYKYKLRWLKQLQNYIKDQIKKYKKIIILGDFNIAPRDEDVFDVQATDEEILCSSQERNEYKKLLSLGFDDIFLKFDHPAKTFSWWDYRGGAFHKNIGYRIDLILTSNNLSKACNDVFIDKETRHKTWCKIEPRTSDHAPVVAVFDF